MSLVRVSSRRHSWFLAFSATTTLWGCSFLYDLQTTQCEVHSDCAALGPQFEDAICVNRVCVEDDGAGATGGTSGNGGSGGASGSSGNSSKGGTGGSSAEAGAGGGSGDGSGGTGGSGKGGSGGASGKGGSGGTSGNGGSSGSDVGGAGSGPECTTNGECIDAHNDQAYICQDGSCVGLLNANCPVLLPLDDGLELLRSEDPIILGGFSSMNNDQDPEDSHAIINWNLAFQEFADATLDGLPSSGGNGREAVAVVCKSTTDVVANMEHLAGTLRVPGILSTLSADNLYAAFQYTKSPEYVTGLAGKPVFFMSTGSADLRLATLADNGLVWHQLGNPRVLARTMAGLLSLVEPVVNERRQQFYADNMGVTGVEDPEEVPLRVTLVYSDDVTMIDVKNVLTSPSPEDTSTMLFFNGAAAIDQIGDPGDFREIGIDSIRNHNPPNVAAGITDVSSHPPHVIVAMGTAEIASHFIPSIEQAWATGEFTASLPRPHYLLSHFLYNTDELRLALAAAMYAPDERLVGVNYALAQDSTSQSLYQAYLGRLQSSYMGTLQLDGTENYYDGAYALLYATAAALTARDDPAGLDLRDGLDSVLDPTGDTLYIGPGNITDGLATLDGIGDSFGLWGTMGPPNFDRVTGTRVTATSAWCIERVSSTWTYRADGLLFNPEDSSYTPAATVPTCLLPYEP